MQGGQPVAYASRALSPAETRYAQIEKELLAIVFGCDHFEAYVYGRDIVNVETDHKPLESIMLKSLDSAPKRLQRMLLHLQKYNLQVKYKRGDKLFLADTLSRAHRAEVNVCELSCNLVDVDHTLSLALKEADIQQIRQASIKDPTLTTLYQVIQRGWPINKADVPESIHAYFNIRDELTVQNGLVFKGQRLVIPAAMRKEVISTIHSTHIGTGGCLRRARDNVYWPRMATELKDYISTCDVCLAHRRTPCKEPLLQHKFPDRPWSKVGIDLCEFQGHTLLVMVDYYSNFMEVERITKTTTSGVSKILMDMFSRYGVPDQVMSDNGPQFSSAEFRSFATQWGFEHITASPRYPQSNGKVENAVKTVKLLFSKCKVSGQSEYRALLDWRNTPSEGASPAQRFLGRRCRTFLPATTSLLQPQFPTQEHTRKLHKQKRQQNRYYDQHVRTLKPIKVGDPVLMRLPGQSRWSQGECTKLMGPRSYEVTIGNTTYRRNRRHLIQAGLLPSSDTMLSESTNVHQQPESQSSNPEDSSQTNAAQV